MKSESIGFIGIGNVGSNLANNLLKSNNNIFVYDKNIKSYSRLKKLKNKPCKTLDELVEKSNIIITCLPSPKSVNNVIETLLKYLTKKNIWIEMSTTDKDEMIRLSKKVNSKGANVLECPITGGEHRAKSGNISILAAGKKSTFKKCFPILSLLGHEILYPSKDKIGKLLLKVDFLPATNIDIFPDFALCSPPVIGHSNTLPPLEITFLDKLIISFLSVVLISIQICFLVKYFNMVFKTLLTAFGEGRHVIIISLFVVNSFRVLQGSFFKFFNLE